MSSITYPIPSDLWMSANQRMHWAEKARRTKALRLLGSSLAQGEQPLEVVHITAFIGYPTSARADPANAAPTVKALIDGLVDAAVIPDDDHKHLIGPDYRRNKHKSTRGTHTVTLVITDQNTPF